LYFLQKGGAMPTKLIMPLLGEAVTDATVVKWLKSIGDKVEQYDPILEVNTDKVDTEIPSPSSGVILAEFAKEGEVIKVGTLLGWIGQPGEAVPGESSLEQQVEVPQVMTNLPQPAETDLLPSTPSRELGFISPVVAKIASEHNVDLSLIHGTGMGGRITKKDIEKFLEVQRQSPISSAPTTIPASDSTSVGSGVYPSESAFTIRPQTTIRKAIAEHMVFSEHTAPHVSTIMEVDMTRVTTHRNSNKENFASEGVNLTFTAYFVSASVTALKAYPIVNSSWSEEGVRIYNSINIGMATALGEEGLIVPVIKHAENLSLLEVARLVNDLSIRARAHKLQPEEVKGGTFTITNHGVTGSLFATPIINQPQCAILGVGVIQKRPVVISDPTMGDLLAIRPMMYLSLTFDHRIIDGAIADYFLARVVDSLQNWS
jgi:pyruvate/2-oxoglutarate dehydrogenase complex dihydrolipoamide acyltransferase (E2) component